MAEPNVVLALDTSDAYLTLALQTPQGIVTYQKEERAAAQVALSIVHDLCQQVDCQLRQIDCFVVTTGPGRFAGMRTAIALMQSLAWGLGRPVVAVPTLHAWAFSAMRQLDVQHVWVCMDARMGQWAHQCFEGDVWQAPIDPQLANVEHLLACAPEYASSVCVGTGLDNPLFVSAASKVVAIEQGIRLQPQDLLACIDHFPMQDPLTLAPCYLRPSVS